MTDSIRPAPAGSNVWTILVSATALTLAILFWMLVTLPSFRFDAAGFRPFPEFFRPRRLPGRDIGDFGNCACLYLGESG